MKQLVLRFGATPTEKSTFLLPELAQAEQYRVLLVI